MKDKALHHFDFVSINRYYGWYEQLGQIDRALDYLERNLDKMYKEYRKPVFVSEFGAGAIAGLHSEPPELFTEEYQNELVKRQYHLIKSKPYTIGAHIWVFADFKTAQHHRRVVYNRKGIFTRTRHPKMIAYTLKELWKE